MADASRHTPPPDWRDAFAALPLEPPPASRWPSIDDALDGAADAPASHERAPWPRRFAWAAVLATLALPAALWLRPGDGAPSRTPFATAPASPTPAAPVVADAPAPVPPPAATSTEAPPAPATTIRMQPPAAHIAQAPPPIVRHPPSSSRAKPWPRARMATDHDRDGEGTSLQAALEPYYTEAARLERVIDAARDPRVGSGPAASLAGALDAELAAVDARLAQPGLDTGQRLALWRERVDLLRASAEFESQLRLLAVEGDVLDGALVRID
jgi:hypothetical protein